MGRAPCCDKNGLKKGPWTAEEDQKLVDYIQKHGHGSWRTLPKNAGLQRCGKSCRLRWANYLRPDIKRGRFSFEEEETIIQLHSVLGNKWSTIAARLPGRTDNEIKNYWNTHIRKRLLKMGIDPVTHTPRLDLLDLGSILRSSLCNSSNHQLMNMSGLLGLQSLVNPDLMRLVTTLLSSQQQQRDIKPDFLLQTLQENQLLKTQNQNQHHNLSQNLNQFSSSFQPNQLQCPLQDVPVCTTSSTSTTPPPPPFAQFVNGTCQQLQSSVGQSNSTANLISSQITQQNLWQDNVVLPANLMENFDHLLHQNFVTDDQFVVSSLPGHQNSNLQSNDYFNQDFGFASSVLSTPSSSQTPLNSSTHITSSTEDERDSYCSDLLKFEIPDMLDINGFM